MKVSQVQLMVPDALAESPEIMVQQRARVTKDVSEFVFAKLQKVIGTEYDFKTKIAGPSAQGFAPFVNPAFVSRSELDRPKIVRKQYDKIMKSYQNYTSSLSHMFETINGDVNKRFREAIDAKNEVYSVKMGEVLALTGAVAELGAGVVGIASFWITGDPTVQRHLRGGDILVVGTPINVALHRSTLRAALTQRLIQSGRILTQADWDSAVMTAENNQNNQIVAGLQQPAYVAFATGGLSHIDWIKIDGRPYLEIQVSTP
ncbi:MAG: hypothetical protein AB1599_05845 [Planctomycetota bacterium]